MMTDPYRVRIDVDEESEPRGVDDHPLPEPERVYDQNPCLDRQGRELSYKEYCAYYGDPERHIMLWVAVEHQCAHCGESRVVESLSGIDLMEDDPWTVGVFAADLAVKLGGYLGQVCRELLEEAGWSEGGTS